VIASSHEPIGGDHSPLPLASPFLGLPLDRFAGGAGESMSPVARRAVLALDADFFADPFDGSGVPPIERWYSFRRSRAPELENEVSPKCRSGVRE
jgi:hypothetical protein